MKISNPETTGIEKGEETQFKGLENSFNKTIEENSHTLKKVMPIKSYRIPNRQNKERNIPGHILIKTVNAQNGDWELKSVKGKDQFAHKESLE